ncbi:hypothetical protein MSAN_01951100 [Mycena sanguinolenta]|uniref:Uncharacterized protein n=1 Tax=Mycena sanguinolenta TaxID=230812 RepID=A0A8H7CQF3_9AGAR|nr:hypothetical protein MSAN_01951100 [Mycena sanguinolenta]
MQETDWKGCTPANECAAEVRNIQRTNSVSRWPPYPTSCAGTTRRRVSAHRELRQLSPASPHPHPHRKMCVYPTPILVRTHHPALGVQLEIRHAYLEVRQPSSSRDGTIRRSPPPCESHGASPSLSSGAFSGAATSPPSSRYSKLPSSTPSPTLRSQETSRLHAHPRAQRPRRRSPSPPRGAQPAAAALVPGYSDARHPGTANHRRHPPFPPYNRAMRPIHIPSLCAATPPTLAVPPLEGRSPPTPFSCPATSMLATRFLPPPPRALEVRQPAVVVYLLRGVTRSCAGEVAVLVWR